MKYLRMEKEENRQERFGAAMQVPWVVPEPE